MRSFSVCLLYSLAVCLLPCQFAFSQGGGFGGGSAGAGVGYQSYSPSRPSTSSNLHGYGAIQVSGTSKIAVTPQALRLVVGVTSEAESANECGKLVAATIVSIRQALSDLKIDNKDIVEDFIEVKRKYKWEPESKNDRNYLVESEDGFRMQSNLHILCQDESMALEVIDRAFVAGISNVISFDYWHEDLDQFKQNALQQAIEAAKKKADVLLAVFDDKPRILNVNNSISVNRPISQYKTILPKKDNPNHPSYNLPNWNGYYKIFTSHPTITYYAGDSSYSDVSPGLPPMNPMISVSSTVTLTYESPNMRDERELRLAKIRDDNDDDKSE